jgi:plastocyanin
MSIRSGSTFAGLLLVAASLLAACGGDDSEGAKTPESSGPAAAVTIDLGPTTFDPADATVAVGDTVSWKWGGGVPHDVEGEGFKSKMQKEGSFSHTFGEAGTFEYRCNVHPTTMKGTITVK